MNAPLARWLTRFPILDAPEQEPPAREPPAAPEAPIDMLAVGLAEARREIEERCAREMADLQTAHAAAMALAVAEARTQWCAAEATTLNGRLDEAVAELRAYLAERIAAVLKPLLSEAIVLRTRAALLESLDLILADADHPALTLRGPADLIAALREARPDASGIDYVVRDGIDAVVTASGLRIATHLEAALAALATAEG